ncbi:Hypothetical_protein [Hexamita inflata]|uniref:Hypothetical_protein n=1 Tax=Hexamita inflata TaxID=28002 RepID=A0AA86THK3_9EUKA|nr:Hypothetical protein HINF_LOCUS6419 [Hexamita inflata]
MTNCSLPTYNFIWLYISSATQFYHNSQKLSMQIAQNQTFDVQLSILIVFMNDFYLLAVSIILQNLHDQCVFLLKMEPKLQGVGFQQFYHFRIAFWQTARFQMLTFSFQNVNVLKQYWIHIIIRCGVLIESM